MAPQGARYKRSEVIPSGCCWGSWGHSALLLACMLALSAALVQPAHAQAGVYGGDVPGVYGGDVPGVYGGVDLRQQGPIMMPPFVGLPPGTVVIDRLDRADDPSEDALPYFIPARLINRDYPNAFRDSQHIPSPYEDRDKLDRVCVTRPGEPVEVEGYISSPFVIEGSSLDLFERPLVFPPRAKPVNSACNGPHCMDAYEFEVLQFSKDIGCPTGNTTLVGYDGMSPGPTIITGKGRQSLVRFINRLLPGKAGPPPMRPLPPCGENGRDPAFGITIHQHGGANLAPYDGWADDFICGNEFKDYIWPNQAAKTLWYHDHHLDHTTESVYNGLKGFFIISDKVSEGGCGEPWGLEDIPEWPLALSDIVFKPNCNLLYDVQGIHDDNLYGDVNTVNGVPWPRHTTAPRTVRLRLLGAANSRPFQVRLVNLKGEDVSSRICWVVGSDGGRARRPVQFPPEGIFVTVAERWDVVCDFSRVPGQQLIMWNEYNPHRHKDVPYFCYSHIMMRIDVEPCPASGCEEFPQFRPFMPAEPLPTSIDEVLNATVFEQALAKIAAREVDRETRFNRNGGNWAMNNAVWNDSVILYDDVSQNSWELWSFRSNGGWFHPVHPHLVEFQILAREYEPRLVRYYEAAVPKDMAHVDNGMEVQVLARFGPHLGAYMFHCHNTVHEDFQMMRAFNVVDSRVGKFPERAFAPQIFVTANGIYDLYADPTAPVAAARPISEAIDLAGASGDAYLLETLRKGLYRIFYPFGVPGADTNVLADPDLNKWFVQCPNGRVPGRRPGEEAAR